MARLFPAVRALGFRRGKSKGLFVESVVVTERADHVEGLELRSPVEVTRDTVRFFNDFERELKWSLAHEVIENSRRVSAEDCDALGALERLRRFACAERGGAEPGGEQANDLLSVRRPEGQNDPSQSAKEYSFISKEGESQRSAPPFKAKPEKDFSSDSQPSALGAEALARALRNRKRRVLPEQAVFLSDWEQFTTRVKAHIAEKKLNKLRGDVARQRSQLVFALRGDSPELPRPVVESALERCIWKEEVLRKLVSEKVSSVEDFEWKKQPKYLLIKAFLPMDEAEPPREARHPVRTFNLFFSLGSLTLEYGFELLPEGRAHRLSSLGFLNVFREKTFVALANCLKFCRPGLLVNDRFAQNSVLALGQFCGLPVTVSPAAPNGRSLAEYSDFLIKCLEFGGLHLFQGLERKTNAEFLEAVLHVLEMIEEAVGLNKPSLELFDTSVSLSRQFLFVGVFDGTGPRLAPLSREHLSRLRGRFREISVSRLDLEGVLQLLFIKKGFSTGQALASKLFVLVNELEELARLSGADWAVDAGILLESLDQLDMSPGDHSSEQEKVLEVVNCFWLKRVGLEQKLHKAFSKEAQTVLSRGLRSQTKIKERIEFELENITGSDSENLQVYSRVLKDLRVAYGFAEEKAPLVKAAAPEERQFQKAPIEKMYRTEGTNRLEIRVRHSKRVQSNAQPTGSAPEPETEEELRDQLLENLQRPGNLLKLCGQATDDRAIVLVGEVFSGKSRTLRDFQRLVDSRRGGKTRVARVFPGVHNFEELFGDSGGACFEAGQSGERKADEGLRSAARAAEVDSEDEAGAKDCRLTRLQTQNGVRAEGTRGTGARRAEPGESQEQRRAAGQAAALAAPEPVPAATGARA